MTNLLLAKPKLEEGWIDCSVGEAHIVKNILLKTFNILPYTLPNNNLFEYPPPQGYEPLVKLLEDKYNAPVIITNGAKGALASCFYALNKMGHKTIGMRSPYWALIPPLVKEYGLKPIFDPPNKVSAVDSHLVVSPNNPDGFIDDLEYYETYCRLIGKTVFIHDSVYYTHTYMDPSEQLKVYGDAQIYSASKAFGLSGLRIGWIICRNTKMYDHIKSYMETMTVGVSMLSQCFLFDLLTNMNERPDLLKRFEVESRAALISAKKTMLQVNPDILNVPFKIADSNGMFLFCKIPDYSVLERAKIFAIDGIHFGMPGYVRMNLALDLPVIEEIVKRLNNV